MSGRTFGFLILLLLVAPFASAQVTIGLPLEGYYRPGRYMPVALEGRSDQPITLHADDAVPAVVTLGHSNPTVTPLLTTGFSVGTISANGTATSKQLLQPLQTRDVLIGVVGGPTQEHTAQQIVPGARTVLVHLDPAHPLPGPALAWQSLDAILLDQWPGGLPVEHLADLLAGGMTIAVTSAAQPDLTLPWRPFNGGWVLRPNLAGPLGCDGNEEAYLPSAMWHPDVPAAERLRIVGAGIVVLMLLGWTLLLPRRWSWIVLAIVVIGVIILPIGGQREFTAIGAIEVHRVGWEQSDRWTFFAGPLGSRISVPLTSAAWPIFLNSEQPNQLQCTLRDDDGLTMQFSLPADHRLAIIQRSIRPGASTVINSAVDNESPMARLAQTLYRDAGTPHRDPAATLSAVDASEPVWPTVICSQ